MLIKGGSVGVFELTHRIALAHTPNPSQPFWGSWYPIAGAHEVPLYSKIQDILHSPGRAFFWRGVVGLRDPNPGPMVVSERMSWLAGMLGCWDAGTLGFWGAGTPLKERLSDRPPTTKHLK